MVKKTVWQFLTKRNVFLPYDLESVLFGVYPNELKSLCPHKNLDMDVYRSLIHNCRNLKVTKKVSR